MATKKKAAKKKTRKVARNSENGEFVTKEYAVSHPDTTEIETIQAWQRGEHIECLPDESEK